MVFRYIILEMDIMHWSKPIKKEKFEMWHDLEESISCIFLQETSGQLEEQRKKHIFLKQLCE